MVKKTISKSKAKTATKSKAKKSSEKKSAATKTAVKDSPKTKSAKIKLKRKANMSKLCTKMNKLSFDAVDREVIRRFRTVIDTTEKDIPKTRLDLIINDSENVVVSEFHDSLQPYIKHYLFMLKREKNKSS